MANLLQNAFKFTRSHSRVSLNTFSSAARVLIEVEDECGGLPPGDAEDLFRLFEQRSGDRSGLGLGLGISRRGVEANGGSSSLSVARGACRLATFILQRETSSSRFELRNSCNIQKEPQIVSSKVKEKPHSRNYAAAPPWLRGIRTAGFVAVIRLSS